MSVVINTNDLPNLPEEKDTEHQSHQDLVASNVFVMSNRNIGICGERILMQVINAAKDYIYNGLMSDGTLRFEQGLTEKIAVIDIPVTSILNVGDTTNYTAAKKAAKELISKNHEVERPILDKNGNVKRRKDNSIEYGYIVHPIFNEISVNVKPGHICVKLNDNTWKALIDAGKGYSRFNLRSAMFLNNKIAVRLYQIFYNANGPLYFSINRLKEMLDMKDRYKRPAMFINGVIIPAEEEIEQKCHFSLTHEVIKRKGETDRLEIVGLQFRKCAKKALMKDYSSVVDRDLEEVLKKDFGFTTKSIVSNLALFQDLKEQECNTIAFLEKIKPRAQSCVNPAGYVISCLRNYLDSKQQSRPQIILPSTPDEMSNETGKREKRRAAREDEMILDNNRLEMLEEQKLKEKGLEVL